MKPAHIFIVSIFAALFFRLIYLYTSGFLGAPVTWEYEVIARNIVAGNGFILKHLHTNAYAFVPPLYTYFCAVIYMLGGSVLTVQLAQFSFIVITAFFIFKTAESLALGRTPSLMAFIFVLFHPGLFVYSQNLHSLHFDLMTLSIMVFVIVKYHGVFTFKSSLLIGLISGLTILSRATALAFLFGYFVFLLVTPSLFFQKIKKIFVIVLFVAVAFAPWMIRNYHVLDKPFIMRTSDGQVFWRGNNPLATGTGLTQNGEPILTKVDVGFEKELSQQKNEIEIRSFFYKKAFAFIHDNPAAFATLFIKKFIYFWTVTPTMGNFYPKPYLMLYLLYFLVVIIFAIAAIRLLVKQSNFGEKQFILLLLLLSISTLQSLYYIEGRHRFLLEPFILMFTAKGLYEAWISIK